LLGKFLFFRFAVLDKVLENFFGLFLENNWIIFTRNKWFFAFFIDNSEESMWSLIWVFELQKWMLMWDGVFTFGTEIEVFADRAFVTSANDWRKK
jgi:hypothetical protein